MLPTPVLNKTVKCASVYPCKIMQVVLIHLYLMTLLVTMIVIVSGSDILIFRQCSITIVHASASSWLFGNSREFLQELWNISLLITWDRFLSTSLVAYLSIDD